MRQSKTMFRLPRVLIILFAELVRTLLLVSAMAMAIAVTTQFVFANVAQQGNGFFDGVQHFFENAHLDRNGVPIGPAFTAATQQTLSWIIPAIVSILVLSIAAAIIIEMLPQVSFLRYGVLTVSAVPSFVLPFLGYLLIPDRAFSGFGETAFIWPVLSLAVGDLNLYSMTIVARDALRSESSQPYVGLLRTLGRTPVLDLWPRLLLSVTGALAARIPYLLGSTIALEMLFEVPGLGLAVWTAITDVPVDLSLLLWVCALGVVVSRILSLCCNIAELILIPQRHRDAANDLDELDQIAQDSEPLKIEDLDSTQRLRENDTGSDVPLNQFAVPSLRNNQTKAESRHHSVSQRIRFYLQLQPDGLLKVLFAVTLFVCALSLVSWSLTVNRTNELTDPLALPRPGLPLGANYGGESVLSTILDGAWQQFPALLLSVGLVLLVSIPMVITGAVAQLTEGLSRRILSGVSWCLEALCEFIESWPKLIVLLAAVTLFDAGLLLLKLYAVMGVLFAPQMFRALWDELRPLRDASYLEAIKTMRVPIISVLRRNIFRHHVLHVWLIHSTLLLAGIIHIDALLGFAGARKPGGVLTLGSILGTGTDEYLQLKPLFGGQPFNEAVMLAPFLTIWMMTLVMIVAADGLRILFGSSLYRR